MTLHRTVSTLLGLRARRPAVAALALGLVAAAAATLGGNGPATAVTPVQGDLNAVSCPAGSWCMAVGDTVISPTTSAPFAEVWNGSRWSATATPPTPAGDTPAGLGSVSCPAVNACVAVGDYTTPALGDEQAVAESWNGATWTIQSTPVLAGSHLDTVWCRSSTRCLALGGNNSHGKLLAEVSDGGTWTWQKVPNPAGEYIDGLPSVSCRSMSWCTAVGTYTKAFLGKLRTLAETWNGSDWRIRSTPNRRGAAVNVLGAVSCPSKAGCMAVGGVGGATLVERSRGTRWSIVHSPHTDGGQFYGDDCRSAHVCTAVGTFLNRAGHRRTLVETWNGHKWAKRTSVNVAGAQDTAISEVSCPSASRCVAVGYATKGKGTAEYPYVQVSHHNHWVVSQS